MAITRRIILPGAVLAVGLTLAACGGGNSCKRACRKLESCLKESAAGASGATLTGAADCNSIDTCDAQTACQADCMLAASCSDVLGGSSAVASCVAQCGSVQTSGTSPEGGGVLQPLPSPDSGTCVPDCYGKQCGDDGCGGSCGSCSYSESCSYGSCVSGCTPDCYGLQCGDDGCGGSCGSCSYSETCSYGSCVPTSTTSSSNSGALCYDATSCQSGEECMAFDEYATSGMCLGQCATVGDYCPTASSSQLAVCALTSQSAGGNYCAYICEIQGQTYACPNSYDYVCAVFDTSQPDVKLCMPK